MGVRNWVLILGRPVTDRVILDNSFFFTGSWVPHLLRVYLCCCILVFISNIYGLINILLSVLVCISGQGRPLTVLSGEKDTCRQNKHCFLGHFFISCPIPLDSFRFLILFLSRSWEGLVVWVTTFPLKDFFPVRFPKKFLLGPLGRGTSLHSHHLSLSHWCWHSSPVRSKS